MSELQPAVRRVEPAAEVKAEANHITGEYYYLNTYPTWLWAVGGVLSIALPPVGLFILAFLLVAGLRSEDALADVDRDAI